MRLALQESLQVQQQLAFVQIARLVFIQRESEIRFAQPAPLGSSPLLAQQHALRPALRVLSQMDRILVQVAPLASIKQIRVRRVVSRVLKGHLQFWAQAARPAVLNALQVLKQVLVHLPVQPACLAPTPQQPRLRLARAAQLEHRRLPPHRPPGRARLAPQDNFPLP